MLMRFLRHATIFISQQRHMRIHTRYRAMMPRLSLLMLPPACFDFLLLLFRLRRAYADIAADAADFSLLLCRYCCCRAMPCCCCR